jgi:hypothetical protein
MVKEIKLAILSDKEIFKVRQGIQTSVMGFCPVKLAST